MSKIKPGMVMTKKKEAIVKAIGLYLGGNAAWIIGYYLAVVREWMGIRGWKPIPPSYPYVIQIFLLAFALAYYRDKVKRG
jgi:hypothetical protein